VVTFRIASALLLGFLGLDAPKTIVDFQPFRQYSSIRNNSVSLINLNPAVNVWYVLNFGGAAWHLENPRPHQTQVVLDEKYPNGVVIVEGKSRFNCDLSSALQQGRASTLIYNPLCGGRLYLRNAAKGERTALEAGTEFLRTQVWGGENVIVLFHHILGDRYRETAAGQASGAAASAAGAGLPIPALLDASHPAHIAKPQNLGIEIDAPNMVPGAWYPATGTSGIFVSVMQPNFAPKSILEGYPKLAHPLDPVESSSLCFLVAFDLDRFEIGYELGTAHPNVTWSERVIPAQRDAKLAGPDGFDSVAPLVRTGLLAPEDGRRTAATFTGGYKRTHSAFKWGELAARNHGSHYGFIEKGVVFSKLHAGLSTMYTLDDGSFEMKTWTDADNQLLPRIRHARQNGVTVAEFDPATQSTIPGKLVASWENGNWGGSEKGKLRSIRGGAAIQKAGNKRFLIYAVFSVATPSSMARVFQAYQVNYSMLLDMNALEHTYCAVYRRKGSEMAVENLMKGMSAMDKQSPNGVIPRFVGYPDNRDFFYVMRKN
jgi:hypothetical protein